jgi:hypothetical protein
MPPKEAPHAQAPQGEAPQDLDVLDAQLEIPDEESLEPTLDVAPILSKPEPPRAAPKPLLDIPQKSEAEPKFPPAPSLDTEPAPADEHLDVSHLFEDASVDQPPPPPLPDSVTKAVEPPQDEDSIMDVQLVEDAPTAPAPLKAAPAPMFEPDPEDAPPKPFLPSLDMDEPPEPFVIPQESLKEDVPEAPQAQAPAAPDALDDMLDDDDLHAHDLGEHSLNEHDLGSLDQEGDQLAVDGTEFADVDKLLDDLDDEE